jgi:poly(3-hydroxybutyrate) depolymerase
MSFHVRLLRQWRWLRLTLQAVFVGLALTGTLARADVLPRLPALGLQRDAVTVSGLSSGAYMAGQFQVAYSASLSGAAVVAGGPYGCAHGSVSAAMFNCSCPADQNFLLTAAKALGGGCQVFNPDIYLVFSDAATKGNHAAIDDTFHLKNHRIWLFSGGQDHVVDRQLVTAAETYYKRLGVPEAQIHREDIADAGHGFPSPLATEACNLTETPFLTQCHVDAAGDLLKWLYPQTPELAPVDAAAGSLKQFKQTGYGGKKEFNSLDSTGWVYVPKACEQAGAQCKLHVAFHGCEQGQSFVTKGKKFGTQFVTGAGYNRWAEGGNIVVLYPQVKPSKQGDFFHPYKFNPKGCWDFWGYTEEFAALNPTAPNYAKQSAPQMKAVKAMIDDLLRAP